MLSLLSGVARTRAMGLAVGLALVGMSTLVSAVPAAARGLPATAVSGRPIRLSGATRETVASMMARETALAPRVHAAPVSRAPLPGPRRAGLPQNPASAGLKATPDPLPAASATGPRTAAPVSAQSLGIQFKGAHLSEAGAVPPDSMGAVGPTQFIVMVNGVLRSFNKTTGAADGVLNESTDAFWVNLRNSSSTTDPHIRYDRMSGHWIMTMITTASPSNRLMLAFSDTSTITNATIFHASYFDVGLNDPNCLFDFDTLGIDANALYIGDQVFCNGPNFVGTDGLVIPKASFLAGGLTGTEFQLAAFNGSCSTSDGPLAPQGVDNYDPNPGFGYFIGVSLCRFGELVIMRVTNPAGTPGINLVATAVPPTYVSSPSMSVPAQGSTFPLDALDDRLSAAQIRGGHLWTAHNICVDSSGNAAPDPIDPAKCTTASRIGSRWYDIYNLGATPALSQVGTVYDSSASNPANYWIPSVNISGQLHVAMGTSVAGSAEHAEAATMGRLLGDPAGAMRSTIVYQASTFAYNAQAVPVQRWGDYSYTSVDPSDDMTMWTIQEFADATSSWGVEAAKLIAPPPAAPTSATANATAGQCNETINVTGTSSLGSGFFDPGVGFTNHIQAAISGGVTVNHVSVVDPTHLVLDVSTEGVTAGPKNLTITNPDGQSVTAPGLITIQASSAQPATGTAISRSQYTLSNSDGSSWQDVDASNLVLNCTPSANHTILLSANADLFTANAGFNQDIGIFANDNGGGDTLLAWKESGGFAGTFSPNAAYVQALYNMVAGHTYVFKLKWKTNRNAPGATIFAGAAPSAPFSPTSLIGETFATGVTPNFASSTSQYTLSNSDGSTWQNLGGAETTTTLTGSNATAVLGANVDLFTASAGYNQDLAIFVSVDSAPPASDTLVAWKESGGFAGTFSPNAAFVKATYPMTSGHTYKFLLKWKTNKNAPGVTIFAAAGTGPHSTTSLLAETLAAGANPYTAVSTLQYTLSNSDGATWTELNPAMHVTVTPAADTNSIVGVNVDLFTGNAGYNQDIAIFVTDNGGPDTLVAWKESGGFAGIFSPNAAFAQSTFQMKGTHTYVFKVEWKTNRFAAGTTIFAGAAPSAPFSHTRLTAELTS